MGEASFHYQAASCLSTSSSRKSCSFFLHSNNLPIHQTFSATMRPSCKCRKPGSTQSHVFQYWAKDGRCPCRSCPYASSHTAENSPRYSKFIPQEEAVHSRRANALVIEEPMKAKHTVVEGARRPNALTIEEPKKRPHALPIEEPTARPNALVIKQPVKVRSAALEIKDVDVESTPVTVEASLDTSRDRTPSPPGSRLGRWMGK